MNPPHEPTEADAVLAVISHGLLNAMAVVVAGIATLRDPALGEEDRAWLFTMVGDAADGVMGVLQDLVRGLPADVQQALDDLNSHDPR